MYGGLKYLLNQSLPFINDFFDDMALLLPPNVAPNVPNPSVNIYPDNQVVGHGYVELLSYCICSSAVIHPQWKPCQFTSCQESAAETRMLQPERSQRPAEQVPHTPDPALLYAVYYPDNSGCQLNSGGTTVVLPLRNTNGSCVDTDDPVRSFSYITYPDGSGGLQNVSFMCPIDTNCSSCVHTGLRLHENMCFSAGSQSAFLTTSCLGGAGSIDFVLQLFATDQCDPWNMSSYPTFKSIGPPSGECHAFQGQFAMLTDLANGSFDTRIGCIPGCVPANCSLTAILSPGDCQGIGPQQMFSTRLVQHMPHCAHSPNTAGARDGHLVRDNFLLMPSLLILAWLLFPDWCRW